MTCSLCEVHMSTPSHVSGFILKSFSHSLHLCNFLCSSFPESCSPSLTSISYLCLSHNHVLQPEGCPDVLKYRPIQTLQDTGPRRLELDTSGLKAICCNRAKKLLIYFYLILLIEDFLITLTGLSQIYFQL